MTRKETGKTGASKAVAASKATEVKKESACTVNADVNVRAEPRMGAEIIKILSAGTDVKVLQEIDEWLQIENGERPAYVMAKYVGEEPDAAIEETVEEAEKEEIGSEPVAEPKEDGSEAADE